MRFTVVVPLYNKAPYVGMSLGSLLAQTLQDFEIVVVDDGSTDGSAAVVIGLNDPRIRLVTQRNAGVAAARNRGIQEARGDWVCFLDADDWLHPEFLARMQALAQRHPQVDIVAGGFKTEDHRDDWRPTPWQLPADPPVELITDLPRRWARPCLCTGTVAFKRPFLLGLMPCFPPGERLGEDLDLWFRAAERSPIAYIGVPFLCYRTAVADSLMTTRKDAVLLPYQLRLRERALGGAMPARLAASTLDFLAESQITLARREIRAGHRRAALGPLLQAGWRGMRGHRWWYTWLMLAGLAPAR